MTSLFVSSVGSSLYPDDRFKLKKELRRLVAEHFNTPEWGKQGLKDTDVKLFFHKIKDVEFQNVNIMIVLTVSKLPSIMRSLRKRRRNFAKAIYELGIIRPGISVEVCVLLVNSSSERTVIQ